MRHLDIRSPGRVDSFPIDGPTRLLEAHRKYCGECCLRHKLPIRSAPVKEVRTHRVDSQQLPLQITDEAMDKIAKAMACAVEAMTFEPYPG